MYYVYILRSVATGKLYVGTARDVRKRLTQHNAGYSIATKPYRPFQLARTEGYPTLAEARKREWHLKCTPAGGRQKRQLAGG